MVYLTSTTSNGSSCCNYVIGSAFCRVHAIVPTCRQVGQTCRQVCWRSSTGTTCWRSSTGTGRAQYGRRCWRSSTGTGTGTVDRRAVSVPVWSTLLAYIPTIIPTSIPTIILTKIPDIKKFEILDNIM